MLKKKYLIVCLGILWMGGLSYGAFAQNDPVAKIIVPGPVAANPQPNVDDLQRAEAHKHILELIFFILIVLALGILLRLKAFDLEKLRAEGFFGNTDQPSNPKS